MGDLEKLVNRLYHYSIKTLVNTAKYFVDISTNKLQEFQKMFRLFSKSWEVLDKLRQHSAEFKSQRLKRLVTLSRDSEGIYI